MILTARPAQRLLVQGVLALTAQLVRTAGECRDAVQLQGLQAERRRLLRELRIGIRGTAELGCYEAMRGAVTESDAALEAMADT